MLIFENYKKYLLEMKVRNIKIENYRSIKEISINLSEKLNVFVGVNGSGKTTILDALSTSLSWLVNRIQKQNSLGTHISELDIRYDSPFSLIELSVEESNVLYNWKLVKSSRGGKTIKKSELNNVSELSSFYQEKLAQADKLPVIAYYPVSRMVDKIIPEIRGKESLYILDVYDNALGGKKNYQSFFEWFRIQDDILNEKAMSKTKWLQQNRSWIKRKVNKLIHLIEDSIPFSNEIVDKEELYFLIRSLTKNELIYEEPRFLFHEFSRLIGLVSAESGVKYEYIFHDLELMFHKIEKYSGDYQADLIDKDGRYGDFIRRIAKDFGHTFEGVNNPKFAEIIWEIFSFANIISFWWVSERGIRRLENTFRDYLPNIRIRDNNLEYLSEELIISLNQIIKKEIQQKKRVYSREGQELKIIAKAIEQFVPEYSLLRVKRIPRPHMMINKGKEEFNLNQLSDGEKNLITLVGDIARRLAIANPYSKEPLKGEGVILIDEIDLHLHPSWQRLIIPQLLNTFPNCQFIISTHSPQVLSHVKPEYLFLLDNKNNNLSYTKAIESYGKNSDRILEDLLGVDARPSKEKIRLQKLFKLIEEGRVEEAKKEVNELSKIIVGGDPELVKANVLIKRKEIIGK